MSRRLVNLTLDNFDALAPTCRACVFWELDPAVAERACAHGSTAAQKEAWVSDTLLEWGSCGQVLFVDVQPVGHVLYAPAAYVPRSAAFATAPVAPDAVLLMSVHLAAGYTGAGLGRMLVQGVARDVVRRGVRAIEAFGRAGGVDDPALACLPPADFLVAVGFKTVRPHPTTPRLRLSIRSLVAWREDVETAWERLLGTIGSSVPALGGR